MFVISCPTRPPTSCSPLPLAAGPAGEMRHNYFYNFCFRSVTSHRQRQYQRVTADLQRQRTDLNKARLRERPEDMKVNTQNGGTKHNTGEKETSIDIDNTES